MFEGQVIAGGSLSVTVTVKLQVAVWAATSVAVKMTVVTPLLNDWVPICPLPLALVAPDLVQAMVEEQLSPKVSAGTATFARHDPVVLFTAIFDGQAMVGFWLSFTVTVNEQV